MLTTKRRKFSKNKKKNWKKTNIDDVEEFLEEKRFEERVGGAASEKTDDKLFYVDKAPGSIQEDSKAQSKSFKWLSKPLTCYRPLQNTSKVPAFKTGRGISKQWQPKLKLQKKLKTAKETTEAEKKFFDLWGQKVVPDDENLLISEALRPRIVPKRPAALYKTTSLLPAVEKPLPGQSYNPTYEDHQNLLRSTLEEEKKKMHKEKRLERAMKKLKKVPLLTAQRNWLDDMTEGLDPGAIDVEEEEEPTGVEKKIVHIMPERKTRRDRNKEKRKRETEVLHRKFKRAKKHRRMLHKLPIISKEVNSIAEKWKKRAAKREELKDIPDHRPKRLGRHRYKEPMPALKLSNELEGSLRLLKHTSKFLVKDRYQSLMRRNMLLPRGQVKQKRSRPKEKWIVKREHREFEENERKTLGSDEED